MIKWNRPQEMDKITKQAQELYDQYTYGEFSYGRERIRYYRLLKKALDTLPENGAVYDIGCGRGFWLDIYKEWTGKRGQFFNCESSGSVIL